MEMKLFVKVANHDSLELTINETDIFISDGNLVRFKRLNGVVTGFELDAGRVTNLKFERK